MITTYFAHPIGADTQQGVDLNIERAMRWYRWACDTFQDRAFVANWIVDVLVYAGTDVNIGGIEHEARLRGLARDDQVIKACSEFFLFGGRISSGMARGRAVAMKRGMSVYDFTPLGLEPPSMNEVKLSEFYVRY